MTKQEFQQLKQQIDKIIHKAEDEAFEKGINISSAEFQNLLRTLKGKLLEARGISLEEYERIEEEGITEDRDTETGVLELVKGIGRGVERGSKIKEEEEKEKFQRIQEEFSKELQRLKTELESQFLSQLEAQKAFILKEDDIKNIVKPLIPIIPKHDWTDHTEFIRDLNKFSQQIRDINSRIQDLSKSLELTGTGLSGLEEKTEGEKTKF